MSQRPWQGRSVLIVDDAASVREDLARTFQGIGMQVVGRADNGINALRVAEAQRPELITIDLIMPEMDGVELFRRLMAIDPNQKVMIVSWLAAEAKILANLNDVIPHYLFQTKPVSATALEQRLKAIYFPDERAKFGGGLAGGNAADGKSDVRDPQVDLTVKAS